MTLSQATGYSGSDSGWNPHRSYHRASFEDRATLYGPQRYQNLIKESIAKFRETHQSRLIVRTLLIADQNEIKEIEGFCEHIGGTFGYYLDQTPGNQRPFWYVTFALNRRDRDLSEATMNTLVAKNSKYIDDIAHRIGDFESHSLDRIHHMEQQGFQLTSQLEAHELAHLWRPFGWSESACQSDVIDTQSGSFALGIRDRAQNLVAAILYSHQPHVLEDGTVIQHGEITEASTCREYRGKGLMSILGTSVASLAMHRGIHNIYGEYRIIGNEQSNPIQSLKFGLESGIQFHTHDKRGGYLYNHVDIEDIPDTHNQNLAVDGYPGDAQQLKSFLLGSIDTRKITQNISEAYLSILHL